MELTEETLSFRHYHHLLKLNVSTDLEFILDPLNEEYNQMLTEDMSLGQLVMLLLCIKVKHIPSDSTITSFIDVVCFRQLHIVMSNMYVVYV